MKDRPRKLNHKSYRRVRLKAIQRHTASKFLSGKFCAADASTPVRRERSKNTIYLKMSSRQNRGIVTQETARQGSIPRHEVSGVHLLR